MIDVDKVWEMTFACAMATLPDDGMLTVNARRRADYARDACERLNREQEKRSQK